jgi:phenylacetate-coenzyme A ligase PaaK-like adenylate-forming protein
MDINNSYNDFIREIFCGPKESFESMAIKIFNHQYELNHVYRNYCDSLGIRRDRVTTLASIPFLPIQSFKTREIKTQDFTPEIIFESSGTTGQISSKHFVKDIALYEQSFLNGFLHFYGEAHSYCILGLLPSYLERTNSSLVYMTDTLIKKSGHFKSGFYLYEHEKLFNTLVENEKNQQPTLLLGVTYALLDFAEKFPMKLKHTIIMETGGMKGRREEINRIDLHKTLKQQLGVMQIHSEYGMTEMMSQAYAKKDGIFNCPPWMKVLIRELDDPLTCINPENNLKESNIGAVNIIDLANINSCCFIATEDMGKCYGDGSFEILGRVENSDLRGCGLMITE